MNEPLYKYDEASDTLHITFAPGEKATGVELTDHILLRYKKQEQRIVGITLLDYSLITQTTDVGQKGFPLTGLNDVSQETRDTILMLLKQRILPIVGSEGGSATITRGSSSKCYAATRRQT